MPHLDAYKAPASGSPFFSSKGDETPAQKSHILMSAVTPLNEVLHKKLSLRKFRRKYCTINDSAQTYDFSAYKKLLVIIHYSESFKRIESYHSAGKMYKIIKEFLKIKILWLSKTSLVRRAEYGSL